MWGEDLATHAALWKVQQVDYLRLGFKAPAIGKADTEEIDIDKKGPGINREFMFGGSNIFVGIEAALTSCNWRNVFRIRCTVGNGI